MTTTAVPPLTRSLATPCVVVGAALVLAGDAYHLFVLDDRPTQAGTAAYTGHGLAMISGLLLLLLAALSMPRPGAVGRIGSPVLVVGTALVVGDVWAEVVVLPGVVRGDARSLLGDEIGGAHLALVVTAFALFAAGWVFVALAARAAAGPIAWLLVVGGVIAFLPVGGSYVVVAVGAAAVTIRATGRAREAEPQTTAAGVSTSGS